MDDKLEATEVWKNKNLRAKQSNVVFYNGYLYGLDSGILTCLDAKSGERRWKGGRYGHGQFLLTHDLIVMLSEKGEIALIEATPERFNELGKQRTPLSKSTKVWNTPALVDGIFYIRSHEAMAAYDLRRDKGNTVAILGHQRRN